MKNRALILIALLLLSIGAASAQSITMPYWGWTPSGSGGGGSGAPVDAKYLVYPTLDTTLTNERLLAVTSPLSIADGGAGGNATISLGTVGIGNGGSGATTAQGLVNAAHNVASIATGDILYYNGTNWVRLPISGTSTDVLGISGGVPAWTAAGSGAPTSAEYIVNTLSASLSAERRLQATAPVVLTDGGVNADLTISLNSSVILTTGSQTITGVKTMTNPVFNDQFTFEKGAQDLTITAAAPATASRTINFPDPGANGDVVYTVSSQNITGAKNFTSLQTNSNTFTINQGGTPLTITVPSAADTLVNLSSAQSLSTKTLVSPIIQTQITLDQTTADYTILFANPAGALTYTIRDVGTSSHFGMTATGMTYTAGGVVYANGNNMNATSAGTSGQVLISQGSSAPTFSSTLTNPIINDQFTFEKGAQDLVITAAAPATSSRTINFPDPGANGDVVYTVSAQSITGVKTLTNPVFNDQFTFEKGAQDLVFAAAAPATSSRTVTWPDPGANVDGVYKTSGAAATAGGVAYGTGNNTLAFSSAGTSGQAVISGGTGAVTIGVLGNSGGGTAQSSYTAGDILVANDSGALVKLAGGTNNDVLTYDSTGNPNVKWAAGAGSGTVTSFSATPSGIFDVATATTTPALSLDNQSACTVLAGPALYSASATTPAFTRLDRTALWGGPSNARALPSGNATLTGDYYHNGNFTSSGTWTCNRCRIYINGTVTLTHTITVGTEMPGGRASTAANVGLSGAGAGQAPGGPAAGQYGGGGSGGGCAGVGGDGKYNIGGGIGGGALPFEVARSGSGGSGGTKSTTSGGAGGAGGGLFYLEATGNVSLQAAINADGAAGANNGGGAGDCGGGGGSGGIIDIRTLGTFSTSGSFTVTANGGNGGTGNATSGGGGGGGGGGFINIESVGSYTAGSMTLQASAGAVGANGTVAGITAAGAGTTNGAQNTSLTPRRNF